MKKVVDDPRLIYKCCKMYYEDDLGQKEIADILGISRVSVSRMLRAGRESGIVQIQVVSPNHLTYSDLERRLEQMYGLKEADVVIIPTRTTSRDIEPLMRMRKAVFKNGHARIVYVMNGWNRFKASRDFMEWFEGLAVDQTVATLPQSEAFVQAGAAGKSVVEFDRRGKAAKATLALVDAVREAAGFPKE